MYILCLLFLAAFGIAGGMFIGAGNRAGIVCALICGTVTGLFLNAPFLLDGDRPSNVVLFLAAVAGAVIVKFMADDHPLKKFFREQKGLRADFGATYRIGGE